MEELNDQKKILFSEFLSLYMSTALASISAVSTSCSLSSYKLRLDIQPW
jgi:hypothetical protein